ncbi:acyltransferase family protein [Lactiplantibacillus plantarum]|uniref:acyltransferase family protein n=1 Tax=Lactiplantibacillus plantarum TaxID=1590 RepID=UPI0032DF1FA3
MKQNDKKIFGGINGLKALSCFGIIAMHILANTQLAVTGLLKEVIMSWTQLVYLFLILSAFGMCCGYFSRFQAQKIDINFFYKRRYSKMLPFFMFLVLIAIIIEHTKFSLYEGLIELTLLFGLLPNNNLGVLGVSWTLGVIFVFYFLFPFFTYLLADKTRAWISFIVTLGINYLCTIYFFSDKFVASNFVARHTFIYCTPFFMLGGILFLYKEKILVLVRKLGILFLSFCCLVTVLYYIIPDHFIGINIFIFKQLVILTLWLLYAIGSDSKILNSKVLKLFSNISMEMYLAQMIVFRIIQRLNLLYVLGNGLLSFVFIFVIEIIGLVAFIEGYKWFVVQFSKIFKIRKLSI